MGLDQSPLVFPVDFSVPLAATRALDLDFCLILSSSSLEMATSLSFFPFLEIRGIRKVFFFFLILFLLFHLKMSQGWGEGCSSVKVFVIQRGGTGWSSDPRSHIKCLGAINNVQLKPHKVETESSGNRLDSKSRHVCQLMVCLRDPDPKINTEALAIPVEL